MLCALSYVAHRAYPQIRLLSILILMLPEGYQIPFLDKKENFVVAASKMSKQYLQYPHVMKRIDARGLFYTPLHPLRAQHVRELFKDIPHLLPSQFY